MSGVACPGFQLENGMDHEVRHVFSSEGGRSRGMFVQVSAVAGLVAFAGDYLIPFVLAPFYPEYSHMKQVQSELGTIESPVARWMNIWWIVFGLLSIWFGVGYALAFREGSAAGVAAGTLIAGFGLGAGIGAGVCPQEPGGTEFTTRGKLHGIFAGLGEIAITFVPLLNLWLFSRIDEPLLWWASAAAFALIATTFGLFLAGKGGRQGILSYVGFWQRAYFLILYVYLGLLAVRMLSI